jgi:hypothetical protein
MSASSPTVRRRLQAAFWLALTAFIAWDFLSAPPIDLRREPPLIAAGSGQAAGGGHCSMAK